MLIQKSTRAAQFLEVELEILRGDLEGARRDNYWLPFFFFSFCPTLEGFSVFGKSIFGRISRKKATKKKRQPLFVSASAFQITPQNFRFQLQKLSRARRNCRFEVVLPGPACMIFL